MDFATVIKSESSKFEELHAAVHEKLKFRNRDARARKEWEDACFAFHSYESPLTPYFERACGKEPYHEKDLLDFVVCFLEVDPWFFRSGYFKQIFLTKLKQSSLTGSIKARLCGVLLDAVNHRGAREYRYYCRLAAVIANEQLASQIERATEGQDRARANRAKMMLQHIQQKHNNYKQRDCQTLRVRQPLL